MLLIPPALEFLNSSVFFLSFIIDSVMNLKFIFTEMWMWFRRLDFVSSVCSGSPVLYPQYFLSCKCMLYSLRCSGSPQIVVGPVKSSW